MSYEKIVKKEDAQVKAKTVADLVKQFNISLNEFLIEQLDKFPADDKYDVIYDTYYVLKFEKYGVPVFSGSVDVPDSPSYTIFLDLKHYHIYYMGRGSAGNSIHEYNLRGTLLYEKDYGLKEIDVDEFINNHLIEYNCKTVNDLLVNFNLDIELSDKLRQHKNDGMDVYFNEYLIREHEGIIYYIFEGHFGSMVLDLEPPVIYLDPVNQLLYVQNSGMLGLLIRVYDANDKEVGRFDNEDDYDNEINLVRILNVFKKLY